MKKRNPSARGNRIAATRAFPSSCQAGTASAQGRSEMCVSPAALLCCLLPLQPSFPPLWKFQGPFAWPQFSDRSCGARARQKSVATPDAADHTRTKQASVQRQSVKMASKLQKIMTQPIVRPHSSPSRLPFLSLARGRRILRACAVSCCAGCSIYEHPRDSEC